MSDAKRKFFIDFKTSKFDRFWTPAGPKLTPKWLKIDTETQKVKESYWNEFNLPKDQSPPPLPVDFWPFLGA